MTPSQKELKRSKWRQRRLEMERTDVRYFPYDNTGHKRSNRFRYIVMLVNFFLWLFRLEKWGRLQSSKLEVNHNAHTFPALPPEFDGYKILHLSDLHIDDRPDVVESTLNLLNRKQLEFDLCVFTGDLGTYGIENKEHQGKIVEALKQLKDGINTKDGFIAILGNHDSAHVVPFMEKVGITVLINENLYIRRGEATLQLIGTDDPHYFYGREALAALEKASEHFTISLVHTPELYEFAATHKTDLYLCGHTHGGQICLPGGIAIVTRLKTGHRLYAGRWQFREMIGYTSTGIGTSNVPVRFFSTAELAVHELKLNKD